MPNNKIPKELAENTAGNGQFKMRGVRQLSKYEREKKLDAEAKAARARFDAQLAAAKAAAEVAAKAASETTINPLFMAGNQPDTLAEAPPAQPKTKESASASTNSLNAALRQAGVPLNKEAGSTASGPAKAKADIKAASGSTETPYYSILAAFFQRLKGKWVDGGVTAKSAATPSDEVVKLASEKAAKTAIDAKAKADIKAAKIKAASGSTETPYYSILAAFFQRLKGQWVDGSVTAKSAATPSDEVAQLASGLERSIPSSEPKVVVPSDEAAKLGSGSERSVLSSEPKAEAAKAASENTINPVIMAGNQENTLAEARVFVKKEVGSTASVPTRNPSQGVVTQADASVKADTGSIAPVPTMDPSQGVVAQAGASVKHEASWGVREQLSTLRRSSASVETNPVLPSETIAEMKSTFNTRNVATKSGIPAQSGAVPSASGPTINSLNAAIQGSVAPTKKATATTPVVPRRTFVESLAAMIKKPVVKAGGQKKKTEATTDKAAIKAAAKASSEKAAKKGLSGSTINPFFTALQQFRAQFSINPLNVATKSGIPVQSGAVPSASGPTINPLNEASKAGVSAQFGVTSATSKPLIDPFQALAPSIQKLKEQVRNIEAAGLANKDAKAAAKDKSAVSVQSGAVPSASGQTINHLNEAGKADFSAQFGAVPSASGPTINHLNEAGKADVSAQSGAVPSAFGPTINPLNEASKAAGVSVQSGAVPSASGPTMNPSQGGAAQAGASVKHEASGGRREQLSTLRRSSASVETNPVLPSETIAEMKSKLDTFNGRNLRIEVYKDKLKFIDNISDIHIYNPLFQSDPGAMREKYKEILAQCIVLSDRLTTEKNVIKELLNKMPDAIWARELKNLYDDAIKKKSILLEFFEEKQKQISGDHGILQKINSGDPKNFVYKPCRIEISSIRRNTLLPIEGITVVAEGTIKEFAILKPLEEDHVRSFVVSPPLDASVAAPIESEKNGHFIYDPVSERVSSGKSPKRDPGKYQILKFPCNENDKGAEAAERVNFAMVMATQILSGLRKAPTKEKPIKLTGTNKEELRYIWTALVYLGQNTEHMLFDKDAIKVNSTTFDPSLEYFDSSIKKEIAKGPEQNSLYHSVFTKYQETLKQTKKHIDLLPKAVKHNKLIEEKLGNASRLYKETLQGNMEDIAKPDHKPDGKK